MTFRRNGLMRKLFEAIDLNRTAPLNFYFPDQEMYGKSSWEVKQMANVVHQISMNNIYHDVRQHAYNVSEKLVAPVGANS